MLLFRDIPAARLVGNLHCHYASHLIFFFHFSKCGPVISDRVHDKAESGKTQ